MKNLKFVLFAVIAVFIISGCEKCKTCYLKENEGTEDEQVIGLGEKCGDEMEDLDGREYVGVDGAMQTYCE